MSKSIFQLVDELNTAGITVSMLNCLEQKALSGWTNTVGFKNSIECYIGETDPEIIQMVVDRVNSLFNDKSQGYQTALQLYQAVDANDKNFAAEILASRTGENIPLFGTLESIKVKSVNPQSLDFALKLVVELLAFNQLYRIQSSNISDFTASLPEYHSESMLRMFALVYIDGLLPLGSDFINKISTVLKQITSQELEQNTLFQSIKDYIPGSDACSKLTFIADSFESVRGWMTELVNSNNLTPHLFLSELSAEIRLETAKPDYGYVSSLLDIVTFYYEHTGTQTVARCLIERAISEI